MLVLLVSGTPVPSLSDPGGAIEIPRYAATSIRMPPRLVFAFLGFSYVEASSQDPDNPLPSRVVYVPVQQYLRISR
jgi:hypothetical protein